MKKAWIVLLVLLCMPLTMVYAATEGTSTGTATVGNNNPTVTLPTFTDTSSVSKVGAQIDVFTEYWVGATIGDTNQLTDIATIDFIIWDVATTTEGGANTNTDHYTFRYTQATDTWEEVGPDAAGDSHLVSASCSDPVDQSATSGIFKCAFKLHKTGQYAATATWDIKVIATDDGTASANDATMGFGVNFYAELTVTDATHSWTSVSAGSNDNVIDGGGGSDGDIDISVTANAAFDVQAKAGGNLVSGGNTITIDKVTIHATTLASSIPLTTIYADVTGLTAQTAGEAQAKAFKLWLDVPAGQAPGEYTYTLSIQVVQS